MNLDQYTPDVICHAMGIGPFVDPAWASQTVSILRVLLKPAFDPEVALSVTGNTMTVVALREMLWHQMMPCTLPRVVDLIELGDADTVAISNSHDLALAETRQPGGLSIIADGMSMDCARSTGSNVEQFATSVVGDVVTAFAALMINRAWQASKNVFVRNALARCGRYVGADYGLQPESEASPQRRSHIGVLGVSDQRQSYLTTFARRNNR